MTKLIRAAALILWSEASGQVLLVRRAENMRAFPGYWTFPGGTLDAEDALASEYSALDDAPERLCALRELFEETCLLPGLDSAQAQLSGFQAELLSQQLSWQDFCQQLNYQPDLAALETLGWRVTPPFAPRRFDTQYYLLQVSQALTEIALSPELVAWEWVKPAEMLLRWQQNELLLPPPVLEVLKVLSRSEPLADKLEPLRALANDAEHLPIPIEVLPGIEILPLRTPTLPPATHTNGYFVGAERFVIIDPASPYAEEQAILKQALERRLALGQQPLAVLLTHHHRDHIGAAEFLRDWLNIPVMAHADAAAHLPFAVEQTIADGQRWDLGVDPAQPEQRWLLEAMHTPGHAPGHLCFIDLRQRVAIVGDMLAGLGTILIKRPKGHMGQYLDSLERMAAAGLSRGLPAHGPMIQDLTKRCQEYHHHRLAREQMILAALSSEPLSPQPLSLEDLLARVYADIDPQALPIARFSLEAHLEHLLELNKIAEQAGGWSLKNLEPPA